jgi:hypothetical protein
MDSLGVFPALGADQHGQARERGEVMGILNRRPNPASDIRRRGARLRRAEKNGVDQVEIALGAHALEQHGSDHSPPTDDSDLRHSSTNSRAGALRL